MSVRRFTRTSGRLVLFVLAVAALARSVEWAARPLWPEASGPSTRELIDRGFAGALTRTYDCIVLGNSRIYRGVNPDLLGMTAFNFAQDDDAFNQMFYKLGFLDRHGVGVDTVVMGVDYFQFSFLSAGRNAPYAPYFPAAYLEDFASRPASRLDRLLHPIDEAAFNGFMVRHFTRPASLLFAHGLSRLRGEPPAPPVRAYVKDNGQYVIEAPRAAVAPVERDAARLPIQERYFEASLDWARQKGARLFLVMPPLRRLERDAYAPGIVDAFDRWLDERARLAGGTYLNFSAHPQFGDDDFADFTHLTTSAADRFSRLLGDALRPDSPR